MNTTTCPDTAAPRSFAQVWHQLAARWATHLEATRRAREWAPLHGLNADTLRDIGAPESWVARAADRREMEQQRLLALRQWRSG